RAAVEIGEARRDTSDQFLALVELLKTPETPLEDAVNVHETGSGFALADLKDRLLSSIQNRVNVFGVLIAFPNDRGGRLNEGTQNGFFAHPLRMVQHMRGGGYHLDQIDQIGRPASGFKPSFLAQTLGHGQDIDRDIILEEIDHGLEDPAM